MTIVPPRRKEVPVAPNFIPGERVRVVDGPFAGQVFTVRGRANKTHYKVLSDTFKSMAEIAVPTEIMERVAA
jgi:transcription antitermination factor NusG